MPRQETLTPTGEKNTWVLSLQGIKDAGDAKTKTDIRVVFLIEILKVRNYV